MRECSECGSAHQFHFNDCSRAEGNPTMKTPIYARGFQAGADAARRECAGIAKMDSILDWAGGSTGNAKGTSNRIAAAILERVGKPVKKEDNQPDDSIK